jgi:hypothetical protein
MTNEVKRYNTTTVEEYFKMSDFGLWCKYSDIQPIIKERDELQKRLDIIENLYPGITEDKNANKK